MPLMPLAISPVTLAIQAQKSPPSKLRNPPPWLHPRMIERSYAVMLQQLTKEFTRQVRDIVIPALASISEQADTELGLADSTRVDAWSDRVEQLMSILRIGATKREKSVDALAVDIGQRTSRWNNKEWQKILRRTVGVGLLTEEPGLRERLGLFVTTNEKWFKGMQEDEIAKLNGIIERGFSTGARHTTVAKDIQAELGIAENRARLTARDQVSKLNGRLTQMRQVEAGIPHYIWQTAEDIRVRTSHLVMDGKLARWDDATLYAEVSEPTVWKARSGIDGVELHPGEDIQCRCFGEPFMEELAEETLGELREKEQVRKRAAKKKRKPAPKFANAGEPLHNKWVKSVEKSEDERDAIQSWVGGSYDAIRKQQTLPPSDFKALIAAQKDPFFRVKLERAKTEAATLTKVMKRAPKYKGVAYRGLTDVPRVDFEKIVNSDFITTKAFTSSSKSEAIGLRFASSTGLSKQEFLAERPGRVLFVFDQSSGVDLGRFSISQEKEVLIPKGIKYKVTRRETQKTFVEDIGDVPLTRIWLKQVS